MTEFYDTLTATAADLIESFGSAFTVQRTNSDSSITPLGGFSVMDEIVTHLSPGESRVQIGDYRYIVDSGYDPKRGDSFTVNSSTFIVVDYKPIQPADQVVATYIWCRRG